LPAALLVVLAGLTMLVWQRQVQQQRSLLSRHTQDIGVQAARQLELCVGFRLTAAQILARRWTAQEEHLELARFVKLATVVRRELAGFKAIRLAPPDLATAWEVAEGAHREGAPITADERRLIAEAHRLGRPVLSAPRGSAGDLRLVVILPLRRGTERLGALLAELGARELIEDCFGGRLSGEFGFTISDGAHVLHAYAPDGDVALAGAPRATQSMAVGDRSWQLTIVPRPMQVAQTGWGASLSIPLLGLLLSFGLALLVQQLLRRMALYREVRDQGIVEINECRRAQDALRTSEARYRSIFDSATDGVLILDIEGRIVEANDAVCQMHGYKPGELLGQQVTDLIAPGSQRVYDEFVHQLREHGSVRLDTVNQRRDGTTLDAEVRGTSFRDSPEPRVLAIITDVSERKHAEQRHALLSRKALMAQEEERARISRELHDELGQLLTALRFELDWLQKRIRTRDGATSGFANSVELVEKAADELRRICKGLRPPLLDDLGLEPAVHLLVDEFKERTSIDTEFDVQLNDGRPAVPQEVALCTYRILQESLTNISRHSAAQHVKIALQRDDDELRLAVTDDGRGFEAADPGSDPGSGKGSGLAGMRERAGLVNGTLEIVSARQKGTHVEFRVPVGGERKELS
jgi:PAS domain S-box-containing protein